MNQKVYILILNWNGWEDTIECLESIFRLSYDNFQVVVCDNKSQDNSFQQIIDWSKGIVKVNVDKNNPLSHFSNPPVLKPIPYVVYNRAIAGWLIFYEKSISGNRNCLCFSIIYILSSLYCFYFQKIQLEFLGICHTTFLFIFNGLVCIYFFYKCWNKNFAQYYGISSIFSNHDLPCNIFFIQGWL